LEEYLLIITPSPTFLSPPAHPHLSKTKYRFQNLGYWYLFCWFLNEFPPLKSSDHEGQKLEESQGKRLCGGSNTLFLD